MEENELDFTKLKYVLYARKSTTDEARQVRSIPDQIYDCQQLAKRLGLNVVGNPLTETKSAKKPRQREVFNQMLKDIREGKYDGILAWNPDRLARNMKEGGEIIDMIDNGIIKDLKFVTHHFTKDANGLMLLGMAFVLSKQYSDKLSQDVSRGVRRRFSEGKTAIPKHGYLNEGGIYKPDEKNFDLICTAWRMRAEGISLEEITKFLNDNGYSKTIKRSGRKVDMDIRILSDLFRDPFYYGVLIQAKQTVDLRDLYDFVPATTEEIYNQIQELSIRRLRPFNTKRRMVFYPLRGMIICSYCNHNMVVGPSKGQAGKSFLYYRCDNPLCVKNSDQNRLKDRNDPTKIKLSIRAKVIFNFIYELLRDGLGLTEEDYKGYYNNLTQLSDATRQKIGIESHSLQGRLKVISQEIKDRSLELGKSDMLPFVKGVNEARVIELESEREELSNKIKGFKEKLTNPADDKLSIEQFLNLSKNAGVIIQSADAVVKDQICREIFLNLTVDQEKVLSWQLKPHFDEMAKSRKLPISRGGEN